MTAAVDDTHGFAIFCDDIREEIHAKNTLVGIYGGEMLVEAQGPVIIPQLFFMGKVILNPKNLPNKIAIFLNRYSADGEVVELGRVEFPPVNEMPFPPSAETYGPGERKLQVQAALKMSPLAVDQGCTIRSFLVADGVEKPMGSITLKLVDALPSRS